MNEEVRDKTGQQSVDDILTERRARWLGHHVTFDMNESPAVVTAISFVLGGSKVQEKTRSTENKLREHKRLRVGKPHLSM